MVQITTKSPSTAPLVPVNFLSHGTLESVDLQETRRFYEEVFGFEIVQHHTVSMMIRLGGSHTYAVVETGKPHEMPLLNHNGLDLGSVEAVKAAHERLSAVKDSYKIKKITPAQFQHGSFGFYLCDLDGNWWELLANPPGGYSYVYEDPARDLTGRGDFDEDALRSFVPKLPDLPEG
ncbi:MAG TPA: VOC family protein [Acidimicrobiales bacterium]|nr:VOC family protein [Acidimicrobiales bacterium]